jgi:hypothetical protein
MPDNEIKYIISKYCDFIMFKILPKTANKFHNTAINNVIPSADTFKE